MSSQDPPDSRTYSLADLVKTAREEEHITLRELARRTGVSAGQLSRLESGQVVRPSVETLTAIARALGRNPQPLLALAGHVSETEFLDYADEMADDPMQHWDGVPLADWLSGRPDDDYPARLPFTAERVWSLDRKDVLLGTALAEFGDEATSQLELIIHAWPSLTEERRKLVLLFVDDQAVLSAAERMPSARGRYEIALNLTERTDV